MGLPSGVEGGGHGGVGRFGGTLLLSRTLQAGLWPAVTVSSPVSPGVSRGSDIWWIRSVPVDEHGPSKVDGIAGSTSWFDMIVS